MLRPRTLVYLAALLVLSCLGSPLSAHEPAARSGEPAAAPAPSEALSVAGRFASALKSGDREGVLACLAPDVVIFEHGGAELSREEYAKHHLGGDLEYLRGIEVRVVVLTRSESSGHFRGNPVASAGTETLVLERRGSAWVIVHVHWSSGKRG